MLSDGLIISETAFYLFIYLFIQSVKNYNFLSYLSAVFVLLCVYSFPLRMARADIHPVKHLS